MKIIALGDIEANLPALEACWEQAEKEGYDRIVHTGNVAGRGSFPNECVDFLAGRGVPGVRGSFDENIGWDGDESGANDADARRRSLSESCFRWTRREVGLRQKRWLADLPFELRFDVPREGGAEALWVAVYHAGPTDLYSGLSESTPEPRFVEYAEAARARILILGHTGRPFHRIVQQWHFVNAGSVGLSREAASQTGYAVIQAGADVAVTFRRFPYDAARAARISTQRGAPAGLAELLAATA